MALNDIFFYTMTKLMRESEYLRSSVSVKQMLEGLGAIKLFSEQHFRPAIITVGVQNIRRITTRFLKQLPSSLEQYEERSELLKQFCKGIRILMGQHLEKVVKENPDLRGNKLVNKIFSQRDSLLPDYQFARIEGVTPELV